MIELKNIKKIYKNGDCKTIALNGLNLNIEKGEFVAIMGKSEKEIMKLKLVAQKKRQEKL